MGQSVFWTVFKADMLMAACSILLSVAVTVLIAYRRKRKAAATTRSMPLQGPRAIVFGGKGENPGHCPLCGRDWPLPGPDKAIDKT